MPGNVEIEGVVKGVKWKLLLYRRLGTYVGFLELASKDQSDDRVLLSTLLGVEKGRQELLVLHYLPGHRPVKVFLIGTHLFVDVISHSSIILQR